MTQNSTPARKVFRVLGTTDEVTTCDLCGRPELKGTVRLAELDADGNVEGIVYYGSSCGAKAAGWTTKDITKAAKAADRAEAEAERAERYRLAEIETTRIMALRYTAECYSMPTICARERKNCVAHGNAPRSVYAD